MYDVTALGELLIDFACQSSDADGYPTLSAHPGGAPGNFLAALTAYGCKTAFIGKVGDDIFGRLLCTTLCKAGIETRGIVLDPNFFTTLAFVAFDADGERHFSFARKPGADTRLKFDEIDLSLIDNARDFHFGTLSMTDEPALSATKQAVVYAKTKGKMISFDPNLRKSLWHDLEEARKAMLWGLEQADIVKISDEEAEFLWDCTPEDAADKLHKDFDVKIVFVTKGARGCYYSGNGCTGTILTPHVHPVDTTGAGDIFGGSALSRLLALNKPLNAITGDELCAAARFACCAASLSTQNYGGISSVPPLDVVMAEAAR